MSLARFVRWSCVENAQSLAPSERRARRCPPGAQTGAVGAARRLRCDVRPGVASRNSLRALRALRSDSRDESDHEARCARRPRACASRRPTHRPRRAAPGAQQQGCQLSQAPPSSQQRRVRAGWGAPGRRRAAQGSRPRAAGAHRSSDSPRLSERSERSERSEFRGGPRDRAAQGSRRAAPAASVKRPGLPGPAFAAPTLDPQEHSQ